MIQQHDFRFDRWHRRIAVSYGFDRSSKGSLQEPAALCAASSDVFLKKQLGAGRSSAVGALLIKIGRH
jgi:hypothetical protein